MKKGVIEMSTGEIDRLSIMQKIVDKRLKQREGALLLNLSKRQMIRLVKAFRREGAAALVSKQRGRSSNRQYSAKFKSETVALIQTHYADFGPTLAVEKLLKRHEINISDETARQWMIAEGLWTPHRRRNTKTHQQRTRRPCFGELVQIDGSPHDWFEGRAKKCCLLVFIDDATSQLLHLRFEPTEATEGYFHSVEAYIRQHGKPVAFYSDRHGIFRVNAPKALGDTQTQFGRAMEALDIEIICANTPQAKGRVEKANRTLQDRLVKELRLMGINDIETANAFLPEFIVDFNQRFAVEPANATDAHRPCKLSDEVLKEILCYHTDRKLSKNLELSYDNIIYQVKIKGEGYALRHAQVSVHEHLDGQVSLHYKNRKLDYTTHQKQKRIAAIINAKDLNQKIEDILKYDGRAEGHKPKMEHPWRRYEHSKLMAKQVKAG
jgi:transposase